MKNSIFSALIIMSGFFACAASAQSFDQPQVINNVYKCRDIESDSERLACYDTAVNRLEDAQKSGDVVALSKSEVEKVERDAFGFNIPSLPKLGKLFGSKKDKKDENSSTASSDPAEPSKNVKIKTKDLESDINSVNLEIQKTTTFGRDKTRFFFVNGQVWEQIETTKIRIPKVRGGVPNTAQIEKGMMGSYYLRVNGKGRAVRVRRVR